MVMVVTKSSPLFRCCDHHDRTRGSGRGCIGSEITLVSRMSMLLSADSGIANRAARRNFQIDSAKTSEAAADGFADVFRLGLFTGECGFEKFAGFLLHGVAVSGGAHAATLLRILRQFTDSNAGHGCNDS